MPTQAVFSFQGAGASASGYTANVALGAGQSLQLFGSRVVSAPPGVTGYILRDSQGVFRVVVIDPAAPLGQPFFVTVTSLNDGSIFIGNAINQAIFPDAVADQTLTITVKTANGQTITTGTITNGGVFHFDQPGTQASAFTATVGLGDGNMVRGQRGRHRARGHHGPDRRGQQQQQLRGDPRSRRDRRPNLCRLR